MPDQLDGARELAGVRQVGRLLDLGELRELVDVFVAVARFQRVLRLQLGDHQFEEVVLAEHAVGVFRLGAGCPPAACRRGGGLRCCDVRAHRDRSFRVFRRARRRARRLQPDGCGARPVAGGVWGRSRPRTSPGAPCATPSRRSRRSARRARRPRDWPEEPMSRRSSEHAERAERLVQLGAARRRAPARRRPCRRSGAPAARRRSG